MATKAELVAALDKLGAEFDENSTNKALEALLEATKKEVGIIAPDKDGNLVEAEEVDATPPMPEEGIKDGAPKTDSKLPAGCVVVKVNTEELKKLEAEKKLVGYRPLTKEAIIREAQ